MIEESDLVINLGLQIMRGLPPLIAAVSSLNSEDEDESRIKSSALCDRIKPMGGGIPILMTRAEMIPWLASVLRTLADSLEPQGDKK